MEDKDRTIKIQQGMLETSEKEKIKLMEQSETTQLQSDIKSIETTNSATQTERVRYNRVIKIQSMCFLICFIYFS